jgi:hypothetical protein
MTDYWNLDLDLLLTLVAGASYLLGLMFGLVMGKKG